MKEYQINHKNHINNYHQLYYDVNKDKLQEYIKQYKKANLEKIRNNQKNYAIKNAEKIKLKYSQEYKCCCGITMLLSSKSRHAKTQQHIDFIKRIKALFKESDQLFSEIDKILFDVI